MAKSAKNIITWYPEDGTHSNIIEKYRYIFYQKTKSFIDQISFTLEKDESKYIKESNSKNYHKENTMESKYHNHNDMYSLDNRFLP